jgi:hypothetical protein
MATLVAFETYLAEVLGNGGGNSGSGTGLVDLSDIGADLIGVGGGVKIVMGVDVSGSGPKGFGPVLKGIALLVGESVGAMLVVILVCAVTVCALL